MATTLEQVCGYLNDIGVGLEEDERDTNQVMFFLRPLNLSLKVYANIRREGKMITLTCLPRVTRTEPLDALRREQVLDRINDFNQNFVYGRWSLDEDGDTRVTFQIFLEDAELTRRQLWSVIYIIKDMVAHQAQSLQILIATGLKARYSEVELSGVAIQAALANPSRVGEIAAACALPPCHARLLHEIVGETWIDPEDEDKDAVVVEAEPVERLRLN
jgi:hypothetical protein